MSLLIRRSRIRGFGVFAGRDYKAGETIHRMSGQRMSRLRCASRVLVRRASGSDLLQVRRNAYLRLDALSRRFNHSCRANAGLRRSNCLIALVDIPKGTEITFDYAMTRVPALWSPFRRVPCTCSTAECRGHIDDLASVPAEVLHRHEEAGAFNDYVFEHLSARAATVHQHEPPAPASEPAPVSEPVPQSRPCVTKRALSPDHGFLLRGGRVGVLLLHGLGGTPNEMREVAEGLNAAGFTVMCPQLAGHCGTYDDLRNTLWTDWLESAARGLQRLHTHCDFVMVGGLSTGAVLALHLAAEHRQLVNGLLLYAPTFWLNGWIVPMHAHLFRLVQHKFMADRFDFPDIPPHGIKDPAIRQRIHDAMNSGDSTVAGIPVTPGAAVLEHRRLVKATQAKLASIHQPTLVIHPREDDYADLNNVLHVMRRLAGQVDTVILEDSYHIITADRQRDVVIARSVDYVERQWKQHQKLHAPAPVAAPVLGVVGGPPWPALTSSAP